MITKNDIDFTNLSEKYLVSNTGNFLYKNFRSNSSVLELSKKHTTDFLINQFTYFLNKFPKDEEDMVIIYSIVIALTFHVGEKVDGFFIKLKASNLKWGEKISAIYFSKNNIITDVRNVNIQTIQQIIPSKKSDSANNLILRLEL